MGIRDLLDRWLLRRSPQLWSRTARAVGTADLAQLRELRTRARQTRRQLDRTLYTAEERLALPLSGSNVINRPLHSDWAYRPELWRGPVHPGAAAVESRTTFGEEATVFHDCARPELTIRQIRNSREEDIAPYGLRLEVFAFDGTFLSLALDLPPEAAQGLKRRHLVRLNATVESERKIEIFARLNVRHGPNTEQIVRDLPLEGGETMVEFDLAYTKLNEKRVDKLWLDLIFESPEMNQIILRDLTLTRRPRADF